MIWFPAENDNDTNFQGKELADLSKNAAVFVRVPYTSDREKSPWAVESVVPTNKLLSDNPSREYNIPVNRSTVIVADSWGNEYFRLSRTPNDRQLQGQIERVKQSVDRENSRLEKDLERAREAYERQDRSRALSSIMKNFKTGKVGMPAQEATVRLYHTILDEARGEVSELVAESDAEGLRALAREFKRTDLESEIDEAIKKLG